MKKIGIITLNGYSNFGNRLQNYALQKFLINNNYIVYNIWYNDKNIFYRFIVNLKKIIKNRREYGRERNIRRFSKKYIKTEFVNNYNKLNYDYYVVGSDQVWNINFKSINNVMRFALFSSKEKNISYAASFGISEIPTEKVDYYYKGLNNFKAISVREDNAIKMIRDINNNLNAIKVIDPTLLLDSQDWNNILKDVKININNEYILCYFLGNKNNYHYEDIIQYANENGYKLIDLLDKHSNFYNIGPSEFIYLIKNSKMVFTDSFHACVFSFIYSKPFVVYKREGMYSRIDSFLKSFKIKDREYNVNVDLDRYKKLKYDEISYKLLNEERKIAKDFLLNNLKEVNENE